MDWVFPYGQDEFQIFVQEMEEQLQVLEEGLLDLERSGVSAERVATVFRAAHTVKGAAGTVGHQPLTQLTHALEGVLDRLRSGRITYGPAVADALLEALDRLRGLHGDIVAGRAGQQDVGPAVSALEALGAGASTASPPAVSEIGEPVAVPAQPADGDPGSGIPEASEPAPRWRVRVRLAAGCAMPAVRAYQVLRAAEALGQVSDMRPSRADIERERVSDRLELTVAGCGQQELQAALRRCGDIAEVTVAALPTGTAGAKAAPQVQQSVRIDVSLLDRLMNLVGELVVDRTRLARAAAILALRNEEGRRELNEIASHLWRVSADLQDEVMRARLLPVETLFRKYPRLVRDAARQTGKDVAFIMEGQDTELDRSMLEEISDPLMHLLRNAVDHGIEPAAERMAAGKPAAGTVRLAAQHRENHVVITVADDGGGIDPERLRQAAVARGLLTEDAARRLSDDDAIQMIFASGFTTREHATALSGRGVGMDVVRRNIERLGGSVHVRTEVGRGTEFAIRLPLTLAIVHALLVRIGATALALPLQAIVEVGRAEAGRIDTVQGHEVARLRGRVLPLIRGAVLVAGKPDTTVPTGRPIVHLQAGDQPVALLVDELLGEQEVVIKGLDRRAGAPPGFTGAAVLADGQVALVVDPASLVKEAVAIA